MSIISSALVTCCWRTGGAEFIEFACEHGTKTRLRKMEKSTNADSHVFKPKMRATAERCPVKIFQQLIDRHQKCARMIHRSTSPSTTSTILDRTGTRNNHLASTQNRCHKKQAFFREETVLRTQQRWNFLAARAFRVWTTTTDHLLSSRSTSHLLSNYQTSSLMQPPLSVSIQSPPLSVQSLCPVVAPVHHTLSIQAHCLVLLSVKSNQIFLLSSQLSSHILQFLVKSRPQHLSLLPSSS